MRACLLVLVFAGGCLDNHDFTWDVGTRPDAVLADGSRDARWTAIVNAAREKWSAPLAEMGCADPFRGSSSNPVVLVPDAQWNPDNGIAITTSSGIDVRGTMTEMLATDAYETVLPHELGHALGLHHVTDGSDPASVMLVPARNTVPSQLDLERAATAIGCAP